MRFNINVGAVATLLATLVTLQSMGAGPAYASHRAGALPSTAVNVRSFGAQGNGIADDTTAIQNAANFAAGSRRSLFFPPGTYLHGGFITFNGVAVNGSGTASVLLAADNNSTAVALTGSNPSIQNMVISSAGLGLATAAPATSTILVQNANSFTVANDTIVQGQNRVGVYILSSSTGVVNACAFDGSGFSGDTGAVIVQSHNVSIENSLFQNEGSGIFIDGVAPACQSIALLSNTIGNVSFPTGAFAVDAEGATDLDIAQNTIQMASPTFGVAIAATSNNNANIAGNNIWGSQQGIRVEAAGSGANFVNQNLVHNCGLQGIVALNLPTTAIQITANQFGEVGLFTPGPSLEDAVILIAGDAASGANTFVQNNSYQGHVNGLQSKVTCEFTTPHIPASNVTGNAQTQTALSDHI